MPRSCLASNLGANLRNKATRLRNGNRATLTPNAKTGDMLPRRLMAVTSLSAVPPTEEGFVLADPMADNHAVSGCATASDTTIGAMRGFGVNTSFEIHE